MEKILDKLRALVDDVWLRQRAFRNVQVVALLLFFLASGILWIGFVYATYDRERSAILERGETVVRDQARRLALEVERLKIAAIDARNGRRAEAIASPRLKPVEITRVADLQTGEVACFDLVRLGRALTLRTASGASVPPSQLGLFTVPGFNDDTLLRRPVSGGGFLAYFTVQEQTCIVHADDEWYRSRLIDDLEGAAAALDAPEAAEQRSDFAIAYKPSTLFADFTTAQAKEARLLGSRSQDAFTPDDVLKSQNARFGGGMTYFALLGRYNPFEAPEGVGEAPVSGTNAFVLYRWAEPRDLISVAADLRFALLVVSGMYALVYLVIWLQADRLYAPMRKLESYIAQLRTGEAFGGYLPVQTAGHWSGLARELNEMIRYHLTIRRHFAEAKEAARLERSWTDATAGAMGAAVESFVSEGLAANPTSEWLTISNGTDRPVLAPHPNCIERFNGTSLLYQGVTRHKEIVALFVAGPAPVAAYLAASLSGILARCQMNEARQIFQRMEAALLAKQEAGKEFFGGAAFVVLDAAGNVMTRSGACEWIKERNPDGALELRVSGLTESFRTILGRLAEPSFDLYGQTLTVARFHDKAESPPPPSDPA